jgi:urea-proton symporter
MSQGFSADVAAPVPGYVLGGVASFSVPWTVGTVVGLGSIALEKTPVFPTYPRVSLESHPIIPKLMKYVDDYKRRSR